MFLRSIRAHSISTCGPVFVLGLTVVPSFSQGTSPSPPLPAPSSSNRRGLEIPAASRPANPPASRPSGAPVKPKPRASGVATPESRPVPTLDGSGSEELNALLSQTTPSALALAEVLKLRGPNESVIARAADEILRDPVEAEAAVRAALKTSNASLLIVAARAISRLSMSGAGDELMVALRRVPPSDAVGALVDALVTLEQRGAVDRLFELAEHRNATIRARAASALDSLIGASEETRIQGLVASRRSETRQFGARLLGRLDTVSSFDSLVRLCADSSSAVAFAAAEALSRHGLAIARAQLTQTAMDSPIDRVFGYLCIALALREEQKGEPISEDLLSPALAGATQPDPFIAASSALILGSLAFNASDAKTSANLEAKVVPALVTAASGERYFPDFSSIHSLAIRKLALLTSKDFGENGPAWAQWWRDNQLTFRANRQVFDLPDEPMLSTLAVDLSVSDLHFTLRGDGAPAGPYDAQLEDYVLSDADLRDLSESLRESGLPGVKLDARKPSNGASALPSAAVTSTPLTRPGQITLRDPLQRKSVPDRSAAEWPGRDRFFATCATLRQANIWQRYRDPAGDKSREAFLTTERAFFAAEADPVARARHLCVLIAAALPSLGKDRREVAFRDLVAIPSAVAGLDEPLAHRFIAHAADLDPASPVTERFFALVSGSLSVKLQATLVNALEKEPRAKASEILRRAFDACDLSVARANAGAGQGWVRAAAIDRLAASKEAADWALVQATLRDPSEEAVIAAAGAVGRHKLAAAVPDLVALEASASMPVRRAAVTALGKIGGPDALEPIWRAANSDDPALQRTALTAMGDCQDPRSVDFLVNTWLRTATAPGPTSDLGAAARAALLRIGGDKARLALRNKLDIPKASARSEVAIALSELGDAAAVPALLEGLDGPRDPRVQSALVAVTCQDYFSSTDAPKLYRGWWATHRASMPAEWFAEACSAESAILAVDASILTNGKSLAAVPSLVQVLTQSNEWYLRTNAVRYLEAATGRSFGAVDKTTPSEERRRIANEFQKLYEGVKQ